MPAYGLPNSSVGFTGSTCQYRTPAFASQSTNARAGAPKVPGNVACMTASFLESGLPALAATAASCLAVGRLVMCASTPRPGSIGRSSCCSPWKSRMADPSWYRCTFA